MLAYLYIYIGRVLLACTMPVINIYLDEELFELVKKDKSKIIQRALKEYKQAHKKLKERDAPPQSP